MADRVTRALAFLLGLALGAAVATMIVVAIDTLYHSQEPPPPFVEPYDGEALGT